MSPAARYFDADVVLGPGDFMGPDLPMTTEAILAAMDHFGIHEAMVRDAMGEIGSAAIANERILERTAGNPRLHPAWMLLPPRTRELPAPSEMVDRMRHEGVGAAWLNYGAYGLPLESWCVDDLLEPLAEARVPVFLSPIDRREGARVDQTDWSGVVRICQAFPGLPVVVSEQRIYKTQRTFIAAMEACPNLRIDFSCLWLHGMIEWLCREFGAERVLWGSKLPYHTPGATLMQLNYSDISQEQLDQIAGGNLRRLISWNNAASDGPSEVSFPAPTDALQQAARHGEDMSGQDFYDCHGHFGMANQRHVVIDSPAELLREMDRTGVKTVCVFHWMAGGDVRRANDVTFEAVKNFPDRYVGFAMLNPNHGDREAHEELERGLERGMRGIKMVSSIHRYPDDGPVIDTACRFADEHGLFFLNHTWGSVENLRRRLDSYPNVCFITGHSAGGYRALVRGFPNLYICTCPFLNWRQTETYVERYGADRILFGSDLLDLPIAWGLGPILYARIPEEEKRLILGENLKRLLRRYGRPSTG